MAIAFVAAGAISVNTTDAFVDVVAPALSVGDIMICVLLGKDNIDHTGVSGGAWTEIGTQTNNGTGMTTSHWWKRAELGDSGATFRFEKASDNNIFFAGVISAWSGCVTSGSPIDAGTPTVSSNSSSDTVTYADFDPTAISCTVIASGIYNEDSTTAGSISGTNPTFTNRYDLETATDTDCSFFGYSGTSDGTATGARSHATVSMTDAINQGWLFALLPQPTAAITGTITAGVSEAAIVAGGKTSIITLTDGKWIAAGASFDAQRDEIIAGHDSAQSEGTGWDAVPKATQGVAGVVRTSDTVVTVTWDAFATYNITATETITVTVPSTAMDWGGAVVGSPTFTVAVAATLTTRMTLMGVGI